MNILAIGLVSVSLFSSLPHQSKSQADKCFALTEMIRSAVVARDAGVPLSKLLSIMSDSGLDYLDPAIAVLYEHRNITPAIAADTFFEVCHEDDKVKTSSKILELPSQKNGAER